MSWIIETWMKNHLVIDSNYNVINLWCPFFINNKSQIMLGLHFVLVNPYRWFTVGIEQNVEKLVTLNTLFSVVKKGVLVRLTFFRTSPLMKPQPNLYHWPVLATIARLLGTGALQAKESIIWAIIDRSYARRLGKQVQAMSYLKSEYASRFRSTSQS